MGFPDLQDGRSPRGGAGAELTPGPAPADWPDADPAGYRPPVPGSDAAPWRANNGPGNGGPAHGGPGDTGSRPAGRSGAHRRAVTGPQKQPWPAAPAGPRPGGPLRGFPPAPGQPDPVYPPGQFSPWNRASTRSAWLGIAAAGSGATDADPGYSALAVSDAAADLTSTQSWTAIDDEPAPNPSLPARSGRDWGSHTGEPPWQRPGDSRAPGALGPGSQATDTRAAGPGRGRGTGRAPGTGRPGVGADEPATSPRGLAGTSTGLAGTATGLAATATGPAGTATGPQGRPETATDTQEAAGTATGPQAPAGPAGQGRRGASERVAHGGRAAARKARGTLVEDEEERGGRRPRKRRRSNVMMAGLLLTPVLVVLAVVAGYVYLTGKHAPAPANSPAPSHPAAAPKSQAPTPAPTPTLGPWKHIENHSQDPALLTVSQLFPAKFDQQGATGTRTISKSGTRCTNAVFGSKLAAAIRKAKCTQVLRASYLSTDHKIMATVGVLNLDDVTGAEKAGKAAGSSEFIKQLPSRRGPTRNLAKGTGIEVAEVKGHYLILIWTEFANLHSPSGKSQRKKLESFAEGLVAGTANVSLSNRMVTGHP